MQQGANRGESCSAPDMSDLLRGKLARFSQERLARFLNKLDMHVHIQVPPLPRRMARAGITVEFLPAS